MEIRADAVKQTIEVWTAKESFKKCFDMAEKAVDEAIKKGEFSCSVTFDDGEMESRELGNFFKKFLEKEFGYTVSFNEDRIYIGHPAYYSKKVYSFTISWEY